MQALRRSSAMCMRAARIGLMPQRPASVASPAVFFGQVCACCFRLLLLCAPLQACPALRLPPQQTSPALRLPLAPSPAAAAPASAAPCAFAPALPHSPIRVAGSARLWPPSVLNLGQNTLHCGCAKTSVLPTIGRPFAAASCQTLDCARTHAQPTRSCWRLAIRSCEPLCAVALASSPTCPPQQRCVCSPARGLASDPRLRV